VNARCAPKGVGRGHLANQCADISWNARPSGAMLALPRPEEAKAATMPGQNRRWLHHMECRAPTGPSVRQPCPQQTINRVKRSRGRRERLQLPADVEARGSPGAEPRMNGPTTGASGGTKRRRTRWIEPIPSSSQPQSSQGVPRFWQAQDTPAGYRRVLAISIDATRLKFSVATPPLHSGTARTEAATLDTAPAVILDKVRRFCQRTSGTRH
jgi:hypothetical protein